VQKVVAMPRIIVPVDATPGLCTRVESLECTVLQSATIPGTPVPLYSTEFKYSTPVPGTCM
jgi:hypothetical protein